jgi:SWIM/SEC-C metal-binding protein
LAKIGTLQRPAVIRVHTAERAQQWTDLCQEHGIHLIVGVEPDKPEDVSDAERALSPPEPVRALPKVGRNDPCSCGSGKKFKKCCDGLPART